MEIRQLRQFVTLAETLNFRAAARQLNMAQPPLSVSIQKLEAELQVKLFDRSTRAVRLTSAGQAILSEARKALLHIGEVSRVAQATGMGLSGRLRIGFVGTAKYHFIPHVLTRFRQQYPEVTIELREIPNSELMRALAIHELDIAIVRYPTVWPNQFEHEILDDDEMVVALHSTHPLARLDTIPLEMIAGEPYIHYTSNEVPGLQSIAIGIFQSGGFLPRISQQAIHVEAVICLVESGFGIGIVPSVVQSIQSPRIVYRRLSAGTKGVSVHLAALFDPDYETIAGRHFRAVARSIYKDVLRNQTSFKSI